MLISFQAYIDNAWVQKAVPWALNSIAIGHLIFTLVTQQSQYCH